MVGVDVMEATSGAIEQVLTRGGLVSHAAMRSWGDAEPASIVSATRLHVTVSSHVVRIFYLTRATSDMTPRNYFFVFLHNDP